MAQQKFPAIGAYITEELHAKLKYLAFKKGTSMSKLLVALVMAATKDITLDQALMKDNNEKTITPT